MARAGSCAGGKVVQRQVLYLGEINDGQRKSWCRTAQASGTRSIAKSCARPDLNSKSGFVCASA